MTTSKASFTYKTSDNFNKNQEILGVGWPHIASLPPALRTFVGRSLCPLLIPQECPSQRRTGHTEESNSGCAVALGSKDCVPPVGGPGLLPLRVSIW